MSEAKHLLLAPEGFRSREVALFVAQLDDQSRRLTEDTRGATPDELSWQPGPGMNTIGMLLAHIAIVEVYWVRVATEGPETADTRPALGIGADDDGMPLAEDGAPPAGLAGKRLDDFDDLLNRARAHTRAALERMSDADLDRQLTRTRKRDGVTMTHSVRWILYHIVEHLAGHYGQINLLRHQHRAMARQRGGR